MKHRILWSIFFLGVFGALFVGTPVFAQAQESNVLSVSETDTQAKLQEIAAQLNEIETEVNRLSLLVNKYVLEKQALALQEQIDRMQKGAPIAMQEPLKEEVPIAAPQEVATTVQEDIDALKNLPIPIVSTGAENTAKSAGFLASLRDGASGLGTPEIVTLIILVVLAIFVVARRVTVRRGAKTQALDQQRQELQERIAWK